MLEFDGHTTNVQRQSFPSHGRGGGSQPSAHLIISTLASDSTLNPFSALESDGILSYEEINAF